MNRGAVLKLDEVRWERLFDQDDLEVALVASGAPDLSSARILGVSSEMLDRQVCTKAFMDFRGYAEDDGTAIANSLERRLELYRIPIVKRAIGNALETINAELILGEGDGGSD